MDRKSHWATVFETKASHEVSWYQPHLEISLQMISRTGISKDACIIDIGGGDSSFVDDLLARGYTDVTILDIAPSAIKRSRERLRDSASSVHWFEADILEAELPHKRYDLWHDRAAFHFLIDEKERARYRAVVAQSIKPGGHLVLATFADDGPEKCSGLTTMRYSAEALVGEFGESFAFVESQRECHLTPRGVEQRFMYCRFQRKG